MSFSFSIQRLVATTFVRTPNIDYDKYVVNHKDENKHNNYYENLEWITNQENVAYSTGKPVKQIDRETNKVLKKFNSIRDAARSLDKKYGATDIRNCCLGKRLGAYGFKWKFIK